MAVGTSHGFGLADYDQMVCVACKCTLSLSGGLLLHALTVRYDFDIAFAMHLTTYHIYVFKVLQHAYIGSVYS